jgi:Tol biopolymer transport system component
MNQGVPRRRDGEVRLSPDVPGPRGARRFGFATEEAEMQRLKFNFGSVPLALAVLVVLVAGTAASSAGPRWKIGLTSNREGDSEIYTMNADGSGARRLTRTPGFDGAGAPSPDGRKLLYYRNQGGVWVMNADGSGKRNLTQKGRFNAPGSWSPDGRKIVFTSNRDGNNEIYVMNADGSGQRNLLPSPSSQEFAGGWSPDGRSILFTTDRDGNWEIYAMNADGSRPRNLTNHPKRDGENGFLFSPDGRKIAFTTNRDKKDEIYVMSADGSGVRRLTITPEIDYLLSWSPDGRKLAFGKFPSKPRWAFFVMNADGSGVRKVDWSLPGRKR